MQNKGVEVSGQGLHKEHAAHQSSLVYAYRNMYDVVFFYTCEDLSYYPNSYNSLAIFNESSDIHPSSHPLHPLHLLHSVNCCGMD